MCYKVTHVNDTNVTHVSHIEMTHASCHMFIWRHKSDTCVTHRNDRCVMTHVCVTCHMCDFCVIQMKDTCMCVWHDKSHTYEGHKSQKCHSYVSDTQESREWHMCVWVTQESLVWFMCVSCVSLICVWHTNLACHSYVSDTQESREWLASFRHKSLECHSNDTCVYISWMSLKWHMCVHTCVTWVTFKRYVSEWRKSQKMCVVCVTWVTWQKSHIWMTHACVCVTHTCLSYVMCVWMTRESRDVCHTCASLKWHTMCATQVTHTTHIFWLLRHSYTHVSFSWPLCVTHIWVTRKKSRTSDTHITQDMCVTHIWVTHKKSRTSSWQINVYVVCHIYEWHARYVCHSHMSDTQEITNQFMTNKCIRCVSLTCERHTRDTHMSHTRDSCA